jgi:tetratricopeptide (TPR) repeat protein
VLEGSIQRSGEAIQVTARLLRVADGSAVWADRFKVQFSDIFQVQDQICEQIAAALLLRFDDADLQRLAIGGTANPDAYDHYLKARYHLAQLTPADLRQSVSGFRHAVALDPQYARAWLGLASAQFRIPIAGEAPPMEFYPQAKVAAQRALEIDPALAEGHAILGWIAHWFEWNWSESEAQFEHALQLDPSDTESHLGYAHLLADTGRTDQAVVEVRRARELSPTYPWPPHWKARSCIGRNASKRHCRDSKKPDG